MKPEWTEKSDREYFSLLGMADCPSRDDELDCQQCPVDRPFKVNLAMAVLYLMILLLAVSKVIRLRLPIQSFTSSQPPTLPPSNSSIYTLTPQTCHLFTFPPIHHPPSHPSTHLLVATLPPIHPLTLLHFRPITNPPIYTKSNLLNFSFPRSHP